MLAQQVQMWSSNMEAPDAVCFFLSFLFFLFFLIYFLLNALHLKRWSASERTTRACGVGIGCCVKCLYLAVIAAAAAAAGAGVLLLVPVAGGGPHPTPPLLPPPPPLAHHHLHHPHYQLWFDRMVG